MLELLRIASALSKLTVEDGESAAFLDHAQAVFNQEFDTMNTEVHSLVLFLHPLCKRLAIYQTMKKQTFEDFHHTALTLAQK
jgi:hypothetical protein